MCKDYNGNEYKKINKYEYSCNIHLNLNNTQYCPINPPKFYGNQK